MLEAPGEAILLRIFIGSDDVYENRPLAEAIVQKARAAHLAGATAMRGLLGFGLSAHIHEPGLLLSHDTPVLVEIVDTQAKIDAFLPELESMLGSAFVTTERINVLRAGPKS